MSDEEDKTEGTCSLCGQDGEVEKIKIRIMGEWELCKDCRYYVVQNWESPRG